MKKQLFLLLALSVCVVPLSSFKSSARLKVSKAVTVCQTTVEFGEFTDGTNVYGVYGDNTTFVITDIDYFWSGDPVYSWSGTYYFDHGWKVNVWVTPYYGATPYHYVGGLVFY